MYKHLSVLLLILLLGALAADVLIRSRDRAERASKASIDKINSVLQSDPSFQKPVPPTVYVDEIVLDHHEQRSQSMTIKGTQIFGFSCAGDIGRCFVLSRQ